MEFYIKSAGDPNFDPSKLQSESQIAQLISQIENVLFTEKGMVMGNYNFGCNLGEMVYEFSYNDWQIKEEIEEHNILVEKFKELINNLCL